MTTLYIAAAEEDPTNTLIDFDLYAAIDYPISLKHAVRQLDGCFNAPLQFPPKERSEKVRGLFRKILDLGTSGDLEPTDLRHYARNRDDITFDEAGAERLFAPCDIRSIEDDIRDNEKILYFSNRNDPCSARRTSGGLSRPSGTGRRSWRKVATSAT